jgi:alanyl-tRNA synthetase
VAAVTKGLTETLGIDAKALLMPAAKRIGGGAGGKPDLASAGGRDASALDDALAVATQEAEQALGA